MQRLWILGCMAALAVACSKTPPPPPSTTPGAVEAITGTERIGWDQRASDAAELATFRYSIYVDGTRSELPGAACGTSSSSGTFACSARLPALAAGAHTIELASFIVDGGTILESERSAPLRVTVGVAPPAPDQASGAFKAGAVTIDTQRLTLELVAEGVHRPTDLGFAPDGRLFVAEETGSIRVVRKDHVVVDSEVGIKPDTASGHARILALAIDPQFERTHHVYVLYAAPGRRGESTFIVARFRESGGTLADRIVLIDDVPASEPDPSGSLRFGADRKLFVAFDDGEDPESAGDLASFNGKVLRFNPDGTTPDDQAAASPLYASDFRSPKGFDWDPATGVLWVADAVPGRARMNAVISGDGVGKRGVTKTGFVLPDAEAPSSVAAYRGDLLPSFRRSLLIASRAGRDLLRVRLDPADPTRPIGIDRLLQDRVGAVRAVAIGPEGAVYFATETAIGRLMP